MALSIFKESGVRLSLFCFLTRTVILKWDYLFLLWKSVVFVVYFGVPSSTESNI